MAAKLFRTFIALACVALAGLSFRSPFIYIGETDNDMLPILRKHGVLRVVVGNGGVVYEHMAIIREIEASSNMQLVIDGVCGSACTLYLALPKRRVCWTRRAQFDFHSSSFIDPSSGKRIRNDLVNAEWLAYFTEDVQNWIERSGAFNHVVDTVRMPREVLQRNYGNKRCSTILERQLDA